MGFKNNNLAVSKNMLIKSGKVIDPVNDREFISDVYIKNGRVEAIGKEIKIGGNSNKGGNPVNSDSIVIIDASKYLVCPGFIDMHVHIREPGDEDEEDFESAVKAALKGGLTSIACMPNTRPPIDSEYMVKYVLERAKNLGYKIYPIAAMTKEIKGEEISEFGILKDAGAVAFSDDGRCVSDAKIMYEIMKYSNQFKLPLILHEEDYSLSYGGLVNDGYFSAMLGLNGVPSISEELIIARDIMLAKYSGAKIHITHISSKGSVDLIKEAKEDGIDITCDVTPHHLFFNDSFIADYNSNFKVNPPIRSEEDRLALVSALKEGIIDAVASDHAPHLEIEKNTTFEEASFGVIGMETLFKVCYTLLCKKEKIKFPKVLSLFTSFPSKILSIEGGIIKEGGKASITIINPDIKKEIKKEDFASKSKNSPFLGETLYGEIVYTISDGKLMFKNE